MSFNTRLWRTPQHNRWIPTTPSSHHSPLISEEPGYRLSVAEWWAAAGSDDSQMVTSISSNRTFLIADEDNGTSRYPLLDIAVHITGTDYILANTSTKDTGTYTLSIK